MADHELALVRHGFVRVYGLCSCGWRSPWSDSVEAVEALHDAHVELTEPVPPNFGDDA